MPAQVMARRDPEFMLSLSGTLYKVLSLSLFFCPFPPINTFLFILQSALIDSSQIMPLHRIYVPTGLYSDEDKEGFAKEITAWYKVNIER